MLNLLQSSILYKKNSMLISLRTAVNSSNPMKSSGERIKEARLAKKMTQEQLGIAVGVSKSAVSQWEGDLTTPTADNYISIADATGWSYRWLVRGDGNKVEDQAIPIDFYDHLQKCSISDIKKILLEATKRLND